MPITEWLFCKSYIQEFKICKLAQLFIASFHSSGSFFLREQERIFYICSGPRVSPGTGDRNIHHKNWQLCTHYHDIMAYGLAPEKNGLLDSETATYTAVLMQQEHVFLTKGDKCYLQYM